MWDSCSDRNYSDYIPNKAFHKTDIVIQLVLFIGAVTLSSIPAVFLGLYSGISCVSCHTTINFVFTIFGLFLLNFLAVFAWLSIPLIVWNTASNIFNLLYLNKSKASFYWTRLSLLIFSICFGLVSYLFMDFFGWYLGSVFKYSIFTQDKSAWGLIVGLNL